MALLLQSLAARLGVVRGLDIAQANREAYPPLVNFYLWILAEIAIAACDLAEVLGFAVGLNLLFHLPILAGVAISVLDSFLLLMIMNLGIRKMEAMIVSLVFVIGLSFLFEMIFAKPDVSSIMIGFIPSIPNALALYITIGIIGATVMPHNLYLHSALVQTRKFDRTESGIKQALRFNFIDSAVALNLAFFVNAAILVLASAAFYQNGLFQVADITDAHHLLQPILGTHWAPILFAVALIASGQSSTITGTLAGQIVMEGYLNLRIAPWLRRLITRLLAVVPAFIVILLKGENETGSLLILSQVILSMQLGFAIIPLIHFVSDKQQMKGFEIKPIWKLLSWIVAFLILSLNIKLVADAIISMQSSTSPLVLWLIIYPATIAAAILLVYITFNPFLKKTTSAHQMHKHTGDLNLAEKNHFTRISIAVDFSKRDASAILNATRMGGANAQYQLIHVVETAGALLFGNFVSDKETNEDTLKLKTYADQLIAEGYQVEYKLGYGRRSKAISETVLSVKVKSRLASKILLARITSVAVLPVTSFTKRFK